MEFRYRGFRAQTQDSHLYRTPSASSTSNYTNFSDQAPEGGLWGGRSVGGGQGGSEILRELEKKRIREEILAEEAARKRVFEAELRREYTMSGGYPSSSFMLGQTDHHHHHRFQPRMLHGQSYEPVDRRIAIDYGGSGCLSGELASLIDRRTSTPPFQDYGGSGRQSGERVSVDVVPFQPRPKIKDINTSVPKAGDKRFIGMGLSTERGSSSKKKMNVWSCAICEVTATSERGLQEHLAGKKHQAKVADVKADHTGKTEKSEMKNSPESVQIDSYEDKKPEGESSGQKFKFWCRMCKTGASNKKEMNLHKKGIRHLKNQLNRAQKSRGKAGGQNGRI